MSSTGVDRITGVDPSVAIKAPCKVATTANITLSGAQTIDGVSLTETTPKTRVLVRAQTSSINNGIYDVYDTAWRRSDDFNGYRDVVNGTLVTVEDGYYSGSTWRLTSENPVAIGSSTIDFEITNNFVNTITKVATFAAIAATPMQLGDIIETSGRTVAGVGANTFVGVSSVGLITDSGYISATSTAGVYAQSRLTELTDDHFSSLQDALSVCAEYGLTLTVLNDHSISAPGLVAPSNSVATFKGVTIEAAAGYGSTDVLVDFDGSEDIVWDCTGSVFAMPKAEYVSGEHRHCFNLVDCTNVVLINPVSEGTGGDGFYINNAIDCKLIRPVADNSRRDGFSIIGATNLLMDSPIAKNIIGTTPECGINIEPNSDADVLFNIVIDNPRMENCNQNNFQIYLDDYETGTPDDVSITVNNPVSISAGQNGYRFSNIYLNAGSYGGFIKINNPVSDGDGYDGISIVDKSVNAPFLSITNPVIINPCTANSALPNNSGIYISDSSLSSSGGISISNASISNDDVGMDYGVFIESGQGYSDLRISLNNITGSVIDPIRWNNLSSTIADASNAIIDSGLVVKKTAITAATKNVTADLAGSILTNSGAAGTVTFLLRDYIPTGNKYRFQVETNQTVQIDVFDSLDRIVGTTAAGALISTNVVGEACEAQYIGTFGGVRYWRVDILGKQSNWTYS